MMLHHLTTCNAFRYALTGAVEADINATITMVDSMAEDMICDGAVDCTCGGTDTMLASADVAVSAR